MTLYRIKNGELQTAEVEEERSSGWWILRVNGEKIKSHIDRWHATEDSARVHTKENQ